MDTDNKITDVLEKIKWPEYFMWFMASMTGCFIFLVCISVARKKDIKFQNNIQISDTPN
jgi:hypothetical protein